MCIKGLAGTFPAERTMTQVELRLLRFIKRVGRESYRPHTLSSMHDRISSSGRRELIVGPSLPTSSRSQHSKPKVTLMNRSFSSSVGVDNLRNSGLPKGRETHGNGASVVVDKKNEGRQLLLAEHFNAAHYSGIEALKQLSDGNFLTVKNLYQIIHCKELLIAEYGVTKYKVGNMTEGTDGKTYDGMSHKIMDQIIAELKSEKYKPAPTRRINIPKSGGKTRPLGIPSINDKLVQGVVSKVLVAIYEQTFSKYSHGFRPNRGVHTAMRNIQS